MLECWALRSAVVGAAACVMAVACGSSFVIESADAGGQSGGPTDGGTAGGASGGSSGAASSGSSTGGSGGSSDGGAGGTSGVGGAAGGAGMGGAVGMGGSTGMGGAVGMGGSTGMGGAVGMGGNAGMGGAVGMGGNAGAGGAVGMGGNAGMGGAGGFGGAVGAGGTGGGGGTAGGDGGPNLSFCPPTGPEVSLPLVVDDHFVMSGYFASSQSNVFGIKATPCVARPVNPAGHVGTCHAFQFQAVETNPVDGNAWGGLVWQAPHDNWGTLPGIKVQAGATRVKFRAWATSSSPATVAFSTGGTIGTCSDGVQFSRDGAITIGLTTTAADYEIDLRDQKYPYGIIGGFLWFATVTSTTQVVSFAVDDIQWVP